MVGGKARWEVRLREGGRGSKAVKRRFDRKEDADRFETEARRAKQQGSGIRGAVSQLTLDEYACAWWERAVRELAENTCKNYTGALKRYVLPRMGHWRLSAIDTPAVNRFKNDLLATGKGAATVRYALAVLSAICADAVLTGEMQTNPCNGVKRPSSNRQGAVRPLAPTDIEKILHVVPTEQDAALVSLLAYAGLRPQEALALRWADVQDATIIIDKAVALGQTKGTKTGRIRAVDLLGPLADDLKTYRNSLGAIPGPGSLVFPHPCDSARPWADTTYRNWRERVFTPAVERAGLDATPYTLRHSFVSLLLASGVRRGEVAEQAGHSLAVMESTYAHVIAEFRSVTMTDPSEAIRKARVSPVCHDASSRVAE